MNYEKFNPNWNKPAIFTAQTYGTKTTVEIDHSDLDLDEVMDAFQTLINGMGYHSDAFKQWVLERAEEYNEEDKDYIATLKQDDERFENLRHYFPKVNENDKPHYDWDETSTNERMDVIGQNGNEGTHYFKDSDGFENYQNKNETKCYCGHTDYCDCGPEEDNIEWPKPNDTLIDAKKQYDEQLKMDAKKKKTKKK